MVAATALASVPDEAFGRFFAQEYPRVVSIAYRITRDSAEAEDVAQDVFVRCARSRGRKSRGWLYTAAVRGALNAVRARKRREGRERREHRLLQPLRDEARGFDPQTIVERRFDEDAVRAALSRLRAGDAQMLALRYAGLTYREIGDALRIDAAQIGSRLARAERALKKEIERETPG